MAQATSSFSLPRRWLAQARDAVASIVIPAPCRLCDALLNHSSRIPICPGCLDGFALVPEKICTVCGLPMPDAAEFAGEALKCSACRLETFALERARSFSIYVGHDITDVMMLSYDHMDCM